MDTHEIKPRLDSENTKTPLSRIGLDFWILSDDMVLLYAYFLENYSNMTKGNNANIMIAAVRKMREAKPHFFSLNMNKVSALVSRLKEEWYVSPRSYPKERSSALIDWKRKISADSVIEILRENKDSFFDMVRREKSIERWYTNFARWFNTKNSEEYFPVDWDLLTSSVRSRIKKIIGLTSPNMKVTDLPNIRFATKDEIMGHPYFRAYFAQSLIRMKKLGFSFHTAIPIILHSWNITYWFTGLKVPTSLNKAKGKTTFESVIWAPDVKIESILWALNIPISLWKRKRLPWEFGKLLPRVNIFLP